MLEMVIVLLMMGMIVSVAVPRAMKSSPKQEVDRAARQLARDFEGARMRAMATKRIVRMSFYENKSFYCAFMDMTSNRSGTISETLDEARNSRLVAHGSYGGIPGVILAGQVEFGQGTASTGPYGNSASDAITFDNDHVEFNTRGMVTPIGGGGVIFLTHLTDPDAVAAVTVSGSGAFRSWRYRGGEWK